MTIMQIKQFLSVLKYGNFSEAAEEMYMSQSSFSKQIKNLESELGVKLFLRSNSKISLTPAGEAFKVHAESINGSYNRLISEMSAYKATPGDVNINIAALPLLFDYGISDAICIYQEKSDSVQLNVVETNQPDILSGLNSGKFDFAIARLDYLSADEYDILPLIYDSYALVCPRSWVDSLEGKAISFDMLNKTPIILLGKDSDVYKRCMEMFLSHYFTPKKILTASRHTHFLQLVDSGCGIGIIPQGLVNLRLFPQLAIFPSPIPMETQIGLVKAKGQKLSAPARELYDTIVHFFA